MKESTREGKEAKRGNSFEASKASIAAHLPWRLHCYPVSHRNAVARDCLPFDAEFRLPLGSFCLRHEPQKLFQQGFEKVDMGVTCEEIARFLETLLARPMQLQAAKPV